MKIRRAHGLLSLCFLLAVSGCKPKVAVTGDDAGPVASASAAAPSASASAATADAPSSSVAPPASSPAATAAAAPYDWASEVTLVGTLTQKDVGSAKGGTIKTPFLVLDAPISMKKGKAGTNETEVKGVRELSIGNVRDESNKFAKMPEGLYGTKVKFQGRFQSQDTGSHHSQPWIDGKIASAGATATGATLKKVSPSAKVIDMSDWQGAAAGSTLDLRWTIDQSRAKPPIVVEKTGPKGDMTKTKVPVDLVLAVNGKKHSLSLEGNGGVTTPNPKLCPSVSFYWADAMVVFTLSRAEGGKAVITKGDISGKGDQVYAFDLPAGVKLTQEVIVVDPAGKRTSTTCTAAAVE